MDRRFKLLPVAILATLTLDCCGGSGDSGVQRAPKSPWHASVDSTKITRLDTASICDSCISLERLAILGDDTPDGLVEKARAVIQDSLGRFWVSQKGHLKVYSSSGALLKQVGRSGGGPLEFGNPLPVSVTSKGSVIVVDARNQRITEVGANYALQHERRLPIADFFKVIALGDGDRLVMSAWLPTEKGLGMAVHTVLGESVINSFDAAPKDQRIEAFDLQRLLASDGSGHVFAMKRFSYEVAAFDSAGARKVTISGPAMNAQPVSPQSYNFHDNPMPNEIVAIRADGDDRLWVLSRQLRENWKSFLVEIVKPDGSLGLNVRPGKAFGADSLYKSRLEVVDLTEGRILARGNFNGLLDGFVGNGLVFQNTESDGGLPRISILRFSTIASP